MTSGCALLPDISQKPRVRNPFPQLERVAILPFYNQSREPTIDGDAVATAYYTELQLIPGFEVMPVPVARQMLLAARIDPRSGAQFQELARMMNVDAIIVGSITEYAPYYPPRMGLAVDWYAANPSYHPIPIGYGLPWGTPEEEYIPEDIVDRAEFELAKQQLATQTPPLPVLPANALRKHEARTVAHQVEPNELEKLSATSASSNLNAPSALPADWPNPAGFVPLSPQPVRPEPLPQSRPIISYTRLYNGKDSEFTEKLAHYFYHQDDARFGGWQAYLQRPDDFIRFCCHLHVTETLTARGGAGKSQVIVRWPIGRYER